MTTRYSGRNFKDYFRLLLSPSILLMILCSYTYVANAVSEEVKQRATNDLQGECKDLFLDKYYLTFFFLQYATDRVFAIGQYNSQQYCGWSTSGKLVSDDLDAAAINICNTGRPKGGSECEIYARNGNIVYVNIHEKLRTAKNLFENGDPMAKHALDEVGGNNLDRLTLVERGEYEYLMGKILSESQTESDKISAFEHFIDAWKKYGDVSSALEVGKMSMAAGGIDKNWKTIRAAYEWYLARATNEEKLLHPEVAQNLKQTDIYYQADLANEEEASKKQAQLDAIEAAREAQEHAKQEKLEAIEIGRKNRQLAKIEKAEADRIAKEGDGSEDDVTCKSYGAKPGSAGYINCRIQLNRTKQLADEQRAALQSKEVAAQKEQLLAEFNDNKKCANETFNPACMTNAGYALYKYGNKEDAKGWFTLAARFGEPTAIKNLTSNGWPVPAADLLKQQQQSANNTSAANALLLLLSTVSSYQQGKAAGYQSNPPSVYVPPHQPQPQPNPIHCTSRSIGNVVNTDCQ